MQSNGALKILFIGDIVGKPGRTIIKSALPKLVSSHEIDFIIANGENAAGGFGITEQVANEIFNFGIDVITMGNHVWDKKESIPYLAKESRILRPINYPKRTPGTGSIVLKSKRNHKIGVISVSGRVFMNLLDCPFKATELEIEKMKNETNIIVIDFHGEATSEKQAFAFYFDGKVSAIVGTHTHVQTADEKVLPKGTAYITDVGMTGPENSIIGFREDEILRKFLTQMPQKYEVPSRPALLSAVLIEIDSLTGLATKIERLQIRQTSL